MQQRDDVSSFLTGSMNRDYTGDLDRRIGALRRTYDARLPGELANIRSMTYGGASGAQGAAMADALATNRTQRDLGEAELVGNHRLQAENVRQNAASMLGNLSNSDVQSVLNILQLVRGEQTDGSGRETTQRGGVLPTLTALGSVMSGVGGLMTGTSMLNF